MACVYLALVSTVVACLLQIGTGLEGVRGGRVVWTCNDQLLAVTGFDRSSV